MNERCTTTTPHQPHHWIDTDSNGYSCDGRVDMYPVGILWAFILRWVYRHTSQATKDRWGWTWTPNA